MERLPLIVIGEIESTIIFPSPNPRNVYPQLRIKIIIGPIKENPQHLPARVNPSRFVPGFVPIQAGQPPH